jgi:hypothetical protein
MTDLNKQSEDYISLSTIKNAIWEFIHFVFRFFSFILSAIVRYKYLFFGTIIVSVLLAYLYSTIKSPYYETEMIVQQNNLPRKAYGEIIYNLDALTSSHSYGDLANELKISRDDARHITSMEPLSLSNDPLSQDTSSLVGLPLKIKVKVKDNNMIPRLQTALVNYLNNNPFVKNTRESQKMVFTQKLEFIDREQKKLDSLKETYNRTLATMRLPTTFYNNGLDPAEIYKHSMDLASQKAIILRWLNEESNGVLLIDGFKRPENPQSVSRTKIMLFGLIFGLALGLILSILAALKGRMNQVYS